MNTHFGYSADDLSRQYNPDNWTTNADAAKAASMAQSLAARQNLTAHVDLAYGDSADERLDIFPAGAPSAPVHVFFHGGGWSRGTKEGACYTAEMIVRAGGTFVAVNFAKVDTASLAEITRQSQAAVAWVYRNIADYGGDPARLYVSGKSSGAQQAAMVACTDWAAFGLPGDVVKGAVLVSGSYDLEPLSMTNGRDLQGIDEDAVRDLSAIRHIPQRGFPVAVVYAEHDSQELHRQARDFAAAWNAAGHSSSLIMEEDVDHFSIGAPFADPTSLLGRAVLAQMSLI